MAQILAGFGDSDTWMKCSGHQNDPRTDNDKIEKQIQFLTGIHLAKLKAFLGKNDETDIAIADNLIRYLVDLDIVEIIRFVQKNDSSSVFKAVQNLIEASVTNHAETLAEKQFYGEKS